MITNSIQITPETEIRRIRIMPAPGKVLVRKGERIGSGDVIAETKVFSKYYGLDVARGLGVSAEEVLGYMRFPVGKDFRKGNILAGPRGIPRRVVRAPFDGSLVEIFRGVAILKDIGQPYYLKSGYSGKVAGLIPQRGAIIESRGALIQGIWGNGNLGAGHLVGSNGSYYEEWFGDVPPNEFKNNVFFTRDCLDEITLRRIKNIPLNGLILPSINPALVQELLDFPFAVVILDSFGNRSMNIEAQNILSKSVGEYVEIIAEPWDRDKDKRPEVIIPHTRNKAYFITTSKKNESEGQLVRIVSSPYAGELGRYLFTNKVSRLSNGLFSKSAEVILNNGIRVTVPLNNLEFVELR